MVAGTELAHTLAYRLVYPQASLRWHVLSSTGHGYAAWFPLLAGLAGGVVVAALVSEAVDASRGRPARSLPAWAFGLLPLAAFTVQEFTERWLALGGFPWWMVEQPTFRVGLLLQLPFALAAFLVARLFLRVARRVGAALQPKRRAPGLSSGASCPARCGRAVALRSSTLATGHAGRAPPVMRASLLCP